MLASLATLNLRLITLLPYVFVWFARQQSGVDVAAW
jgi:hypothetical protein